MKTPNVNWLLNINIPHAYQVTRVMKSVKAIPKALEIIECLLHKNAKVNYLPHKLPISIKVHFISLMHCPTVLVLTMNDKQAANSLDWRESSRSIPIPIPPQPLCFHYWPMLFVFCWFFSAVHVVTFYVHLDCVAFQHKQWCSLILCSR